jgi:hypothetical protein
MATFKTKEEYELVMSLIKSGMKVCDIVELTGFTRSCISNWVNRGPRNFNINRQPKLKIDYTNYNPVEFLKNKSLTSNNINKEYSFLLGMYFGNGCVTTRFKTKRLLLSMNSDYQTVNDRLVECMQNVTGEKVFVYDRRNNAKPINCIVYSVYADFLELIFPHCGVGHKHLRKIELKDWQINMIEPLSFVQGLMFSDGCSVNDERYEFNNCSIDIINMFSKYCNLLGLRTNLYERKNMPEYYARSYVVKIAWKDDYKWLSERIGTKRNPIFDSL